MKKQVLISNFHPANTEAICRDFRALGYAVIMPSDNWGGRINYFFSNSDFENVRLMDWNEFLSTPPGNVMIACYEQEKDFRAIAAVHGDRLLLHTAGNNVPYGPGIKHLFSPDIQTYNNYDAPYKMLYWFPPVIHDLTKDIQKSYEGDLVCSYIHHYSQYWRESYGEAMEFERLFGRVWLYGEGTRDGTLSHLDTHKRMCESKFTLYFKEKDCYGQTVLESMALGTPVIAMRRFISDKTLGMYFLNDSNSIIVDSPREAVERVRSITLEQYRSMSASGIDTVATLTDNPTRWERMRYLLDQD